MSSPRLLFALSVPCHSLREQEFPDWASEHTGTVVNIKEGELFYLPQGWFHEVTSTCGEGSRMHLAVNHWFNPQLISAEAGADPWSNVAAVGTQ